MKTRAKKAKAVRVLGEALELARAWLKSEHFEPPKSCGGCGGPNGNCDMECVGAAAWSRDYGAIAAALSHPTARAALENTPP